MQIIKPFIIALSNYLVIPRLRHYGKQPAQSLFARHNSSLASAIQLKMLTSEFCLLAISTLDGQTEFGSCYCCVVSPRLHDDFFDCATHKYEIDLSINARLINKK